LLEQVPASVWRQEWVVHCQAVGNGEAALKYLAPYIFRVALSNKRILNLTESQVTFRYREGDSRRWKSRTLPAEEFIRRFLQHVLPQGFQKVRYYGLFSSSQRARLTQARQLLGQTPVTKTVETETPAPAPPLSHLRSGDATGADPVPPPQPLALTRPTIGADILSRPLTWR
jgi:hypothetical protein